MPAKPLTIAGSVTKSALATARHLYIRESRRGCSAGEVALVVKELGLEEGLPPAKALRQQCKENNAPIAYQLLYMCSSSILHLRDTGGGTYFHIYILK